MIFKKDLKLGLRDLEVYVNDKDIEIFLRKVDSNHPTPPSKKNYSLNICALMPVHYGQRSKNTLLG